MHKQKYHRNLIVVVTASAALGRTTFPFSANNEISFCAKPTNSKIQLHHKLRASYYIKRVRYKSKGSHNKNIWSVRSSMKRNPKNQRFYTNTHRMYIILLI